MSKALGMMLLALFASACTTVHTTTESDPVALAQATFWTGVVFVCLTVGTVLIWCCYFITEAWKYRK